MIQYILMRAVGNVTGVHSVCHDPSKIVNDQFSHSPNSSCGTLVV